MVRLATEAMGTRFELVLADRRRDESFLRAAGEEAVALIQEWHQRLSVFDAGSMLSVLNRTAGSERVRVDDELMELLAACARLHRATGGAFDVTVGPLMRRWGLRGDQAGVDAVWGMDHVRLDRDRRAVWFAAAGVELDLGGIAKGHVLDLAAELLREQEIQSALLHGGTSTVVAIGEPPSGAGWTVRVAPLPDAPVVVLRDRALSASAPTGRMARVEGRAVGHVLDPRTGEPACGPSHSAVLADSARDADAWSTALLVLGERPATIPATMTTLLATAAGWQAAGPETEHFRRPGDSSLGEGRSA